MPEQLRGPCPGQAGFGERQLADRRRGDGVDLAACRGVDGTQQGLVGRQARHAGDLPDPDRRIRRRRKHHRLAHREYAGVGGGFRHDFRADAGGIPNGEGDAWPSHLVSMTHWGN